MHALVKNGKAEIVSYRIACHGGPRRNGMSHIPDPSKAPSTEGEKSYVQRGVEPDSAIRNTSQFGFWTETLEFRLGEVDGAGGNGGRHIVVGISHSQMLVRQFDAIQALTF